MSRYFTTTLAIAAGLATTGAAFGQAVLPGTAQPQTLAGDLVAAPVNSILRIEEDGGSEFANAGATVEVSLIVDGSPVGTTDFTTATQINGGAPTFAAGQDVITVDLGGIGGWAFVVSAPGNAGATAIRVSISDGTNTDTVDFAINNTEPVLTEAILDDTPGSEQLFLIFDRSINNGSADNDANQTTAAGLATDDDFEVSTDAAFTTPAALDTSLVVNPTILPTGNVISYDLTPAGVSAIAFGQFVRYTGSGDIKGINGREATTAVETLAAETALSLSSVTAVETIGSGGIGDFRFTFNQALGSAGDAAFFLNNTTWTLGGSAITPDAIAAVGLDPDNASSVLVTVNLPAGAQVDPDGLDDSGDAFGVTLDSAGAGTAPTTVLGTAFAGTNQSATVGDGITPTLVGPLGVLDLNGDGVLDAFGLIFNEPMATPGNTTAVLGAFEFETIANATVHPISLFMTNLANGETDPFATVNEVDIATTATTMFNASAATLQSEDSATRLGTNNVVAVAFDPAAADWNGDGTVDAADAALFPGTFDTGWGTLAVTAADAALGDANGNGFDSDLAATTANADFAGALLVEVWFRDAENDFDDQFWFEINAGVGDTQADAALLVFNEDMFSTGGGPGNFESSYSFGPSAGERFQNGDFVGFGPGPFGGSVIVFRDFTGAGWDLGDTLTVASSSNGLVDDNGNDFTGGSGVSIDRNSPYVPRQFDINGNQVFGAFVNPASDGSVETFSLVFTKPVEFIMDDGTPLTDLTGVAADFTVDGTQVSSVAATGNVITLTPANAANLLASSSFTINYNGGATDRRLAEQGDPANRVTAGGSITAQPIAEPDVDGEFPAVMDVFGQITNNGTPEPAGTQVFGMLAIQRINTIEVTMNSVRGVIDDESSAEAFTNFILGLATNLYLYDDDGDMFFSNDKDEFSDDNFAIMSVSATVSRGSVRWTATGFTETQGDSQQQRANANGTATMVFDVLRSGDGTAYSLINNGFQMHGTPIASKAVITTNDGSYLLHVTGPRRAFGGRADATGAFVIVVVERTNGDRLMATSIHNGADGLGALQFNPLQNQRDPGDARFDGAVDIELNRVGVERIWEGWNLTPFNRNSGFALTSNGLPQSIPAGVTPFATTAPANASNTILVGTTATGAPAYLQWGFFVDVDGNGRWTRNDDNFFGGPLSTTLVDPRGFDDFFAFTLTDRGVKANDGIDGLVGGYGMGTFFGGFSTDSLGVFQFGAQRASGSALFAAPFRGSTSNLGWSLVTSPGGSSDVASFLAGNDADFLIEFNRTDEDAVNITTFDSASGDGDTAGVSANQAYFIHFP